MATLEELEQRIQALESEVGGGDNLQPNVLTLKNGLVGADFTGHVHAQGLDLDAGTSNTPPDQDRVRWLRTSDGAAVADVTGYSQGGQGEFLQLNAHPSPASDRAGFELNAGFQSGAQGADLILQRGADADANSITSLLLQLIPHAGAPIIHYTLGTAAYNCTFPKLAGAGPDGLRAPDVRIDFGSFVLAWPGGGNVSNTVNVATNLPASASNYLCWVQAAGLIGLSVPVLLGSMAANVLSCLGVTPQGNATGNTTVGWLALSIT